MWTVYCEGRNDCVYTGTVRQTCIDHGRRFIHAPADVRYDFFNNVHQVGIVFEPYIRLFQNPGTFHVNGFVSIHQDVIDARILQQRFQRAKAEDFV